MITSIKLPKYEFSKLSQEVYLTKDTPIIAIKNLKDNYVNSERFTVSSIDKDEQIITIYNENRGCVDVPISQFQKNFHVAYAVTTHKSQGMTIKTPFTIHEWNRLNNTAKYVALSRGTCWENVNLVNNICWEECKFDEKQIVHRDTNLNGLIGTYID